MRFSANFPDSTIKRLNESHDVWKDLIVREDRNTLVYFSHSSIERGIREGKTPPPDFSLDICKTLKTASFRQGSFRIEPEQYPSNAVNAAWVKGTRRVYKAKWTVSSFDLSHDSQPTDNRSQREIQTFSIGYPEFQHDLMKRQLAASKRLTHMTSFSISPGKQRSKSPNKMGALKNLSKRYLYQPERHKARSNSFYRLPPLI